MFFIALFVGALSLLILWLKFRATYWDRMKVKSLPGSIFFGNMGPVAKLQRAFLDIFDDFYNDKAAADSRIIGINLFTKPALFVRDPEIIKDIFIKEFNSFSDRFTSTDPHSDKLGAYNLFFMKNPMWRQMRAKLTPFFTSGRLKQMFPLVQEIGERLNSHLMRHKDTDIVEIREYSACYATDIIASCAFGINVNSIANPKDEFRLHGAKIFDFDFKRVMEFISVLFFPSTVSIFKTKVFTKETTDFLSKVFMQVFKEREANKVQRKDLIDMLIELKNDPTTKMKDSIDWCDEMLIAQPVFFFSAGFETTSTTISFALYELSKNLEAQDKLRSELRDELVKNNGELTYDSLSEMPYFTQVINETLRLWPPAPFLDRECTNPEGFSLQQYGIDYTIPPKMPIYVSALGFHRDPNYFPDPEKFDPDRFAPENKDRIKPYTYMPFGVGPHYCIGDRFAQITARIGIASVLRNHRVELAYEKDKKLIMSKTAAIVLKPEGGINVRLIKDKLYP